MPLILQKMVKKFKINNFILFLVNIFLILLQFFSLSSDICLECEENLNLTLNPKSAECECKSGFKMNKISQC